MFDLDVTMEIGTYLVSKVKFPSGAPSSEWKDRVDKFIRENRRDRVAKQIANRGGGDNFIDTGWTIAWTLGAFQRVLVEAKHAAAFMCTNAGDDPDLMKRPWNAYTIEIPSDLVTIPLGGETVSMDVIAVWHHPPDQKSRFAVYSSTSRYGFFGELVWPLPDYYAPPPGVEISNDTEAAALRARDYIARLVVGVQAHMMTHPHDPVEAPVRTEKKVRKGVGVSVEHHIARPVEIDLTEHVRDHIAGRTSSSPVFQTLVAGHYRHYWVGKLESQKRVQRFIEPHWRNLEGSLLAVRPHVLGE